MILLTAPTGTEWQTFLAAPSKIGARQASAIRLRLLGHLQASEEQLAGAVHSLWTDVACALQNHVDQLPPEAGAEAGDELSLTHPDNLTEIVSSLLEAPSGQNHHIFLSRILAATGLFRLLEAERLWSKSRDLATDHLIGAAILERDSVHMRNLAFRIEREGSMSSAIAVTKSKFQKGGDEKNATNKAKRAELLNAYDELQKQLPKKMKMAPAAKLLLDQMPHLGVDDRTVYGWIRDHEKSKKPKPSIEHF